MLKSKWNPTRNTVLVRATFSPHTRWASVCPALRKHSSMIASCKPHYPWRNRNARMSHSITNSLKISKTASWFDGHFQIPDLTNAWIVSQTWHDLQLTFNSSSFNVECSDKNESNSHYAMQNIIPKKTQLQLEIQKSTRHFTSIVVAIVVSDDCIIGSGVKSRLSPHHHKRS